MLIDGRKIAEELVRDANNRVARWGRTPRLAIFVLAQDAATEQFIRIKKRTAEAVGVSLIEHALPETTTTEQLVQRIQDAVAESDGIVVQLPLPQHIDLKKIREALPASHDVDCLGTEARTRFERGDMTLLPPVVAACKEILTREGIDVSGKTAVVVGKGLLVGAPAAVWLAHWGAHVAALDEHDSAEAYTKKADIIVLGAGVPNLLKPDMIARDAVILDAGTSESGGKVVGDADPACAEKTSVMTPVPGGVGPVAVAMLFHNLLSLHEHAE